MAGLLAEAEPSEQCGGIYGEGGRAGLLFPAFQAAEIRQKVGMKDRMGNTLKPQERVLAFVSAPQLRQAPGVSGSCPTPTALGSWPRRAQSPQWAP